MHRCRTSKAATGAVPTLCVPWRVDRGAKALLGHLELWTVVFLVVLAGHFAGMSGKRPTVQAANKKGSVKPTMAAAAIQRAAELLGDVEHFHVLGSDVS